MGWYREKFGERGSPIILLAVPNVFVLSATVSCVIMFGGTAVSHLYMIVAQVTYVEKYVLRLEEDAKKNNNCSL